MLQNEYLKRVYEEVQRRDSHEPEFLQAVLEVFESLELVVDKHPEWEKAGLIERFVVFTEHRQKVRMPRLKRNLFSEEAADKAFSLVGGKRKPQDTDTAAPGGRCHGRDGVFVAVNHKMQGKIALWIGFF